MFKRATSGSVVCPSCGRLVGVRDEKCLGCGRSNPGMWGFAPILQKLGRDFGFAQIVLIGCGVLFAATLLYAPDQIRMRGIFSFLSPGLDATLHFGASGALPLVHGRWWTVLSASWLHGGILHIVLNMMWVRQLVPPTVELFGIGRAVLIYTVSGVVGFAATSTVRFLWAYGILGFLPGPLEGAAITLGASASICGLIGALLLYGQRTGNRRLTQQILQIGAFLLVIGFVLDGVDNWAHIGGFGGGYLVAKWLDPLREEGPNHMLAALVCLAASALAVIASLLDGPVPLPGG
ncbi:MAG: rhomboid family intramembrane serine protease [bacterium]|nr:rhomboid family intramembrane serine protease [bacterium]